MHKRDTRHWHTLVGASQLVSYIDAEVLYKFAVWTRFVACMKHVAQLWSLPGPER
jgi:hypothetical protein